MLSKYNFKSVWSSSDWIFQKARYFLEWLLEWISKSYSELINFEVRKKNLSNQLKARWTNFLSQANLTRMTFESVKGCYRITLKTRQKLVWTDFLVQSKARPNEIILSNQKNNLLNELFESVKSRLNDFLNQLKARRIYFLSPGKTRVKE